MHNKHTEFGEKQGKKVSLSHSKLNLCAHFSLSGVSAKFYEAITKISERTSIEKKAVF